MFMMHQHETGVQIVFGMDWSPLIGGNPDRLGLQRARSLGSTHYVLSGSTHAHAVGVVSFRHASRKEKKPVHSAAAIFARYFSSGAVACLMPIAEGGCWLVACHAGAVLSHTDRCFSDENQALAALEPIAQRFSSLQIHRESALSQDYCPPWISAALVDQTVLMPCRSARMRLNVWLRLLTSFLVFTTAGYFFLFKSASKPLSVSIDTKQIWQQHLDSPERILIAHTHQQIHALITSWLKLPVHVLGWKLHKIQCESVSSIWQCSAGYSRTHRLALNEDLEKFKPSGWNIDFSPLEDASFVWRVYQNGTPLDLTEQWMRFDWMTYLQKVSHAFEHVQIGATAMLSLGAPSDDQGNPIQIPDDWPVWKQRVLVIKGPLRSFALLNKFHMPVRWRRVSLDVDRFVHRSVNRSALTIQFVGDIFETEIRK